MTQSTPFSFGDPLLSRDATGQRLLGHDLRAALSNVIGGLRLIDRADAGPAAGAQLARVEASAEAVARLLGDTVLRAEDQASGMGGAAGLDLPHLLHDLEARWAARARGKGLGFAVVAEPDTPDVLALDRSALERVLSNMLSSAINSADAGTVTLHAGLRADGTLRLAVQEPQSVSAGGPGTQRGGLGAQAARDTARRLGGRLEDEGGVVALVFPASAWSPHRVGAAGDLPDLSPLRVLVVGDGQTTQGLGRLLAVMGAACEVAVDVPQAMSRLANETFDVALIDTEMPGHAGVEAIHSLPASRGSMARMPVIAMTAYPLRANRRALFAAGADGILAKPLPAAAAIGRLLLETLERARPASGDRISLAEDAALDGTTLKHLLAIAGPTATELLRRLDEDLCRVERGLVSGLATADHAAIRAETHVLIALAGAVGAAKLQGLAEALNAAAHRKDGVHIAALGDEILPLLDRLIQFIADERP